MLWGYHGAVKKVHSAILVASHGTKCMAGLFIKGARAHTTRPLCIRCFNSFWQPVESGKYTYYPKGKLLDLSRVNCFLFTIILSICFINFWLLFRDGGSRCDTSFHELPGWSEFLLFKRQFVWACSPWVRFLAKPFEQMREPKWPQGASDWLVMAWKQMMHALDWLVNFVHSVFSSGSTLPATCASFIA